jgi:acetyl-CoA carboxylase biotin carboxyl carrier protein
MIDLEFLERLIQAIDQSGLDSLEIERGGTRIRLSKTPPAAPVHMNSGPPASPGPVSVETPVSTGTGESAGSPGEAGPVASEASNLLEVTSPMVGTFYRSPAPDAPPYVEKGNRVHKGDVVCIIEAMKLMNELESEVEGTIVEVCVENAQPVEYGQVLYRVDPA